MNKSDFKELLNRPVTDDCLCCNRQEYEAWKYKKELESTFSVLGEFDDREEKIKFSGYTEHHPNGTCYWSKDAPIALDYYPYQECQVIECSCCRSLFLYYMEYGGHGREPRLRWVQAKLVI